MKTLHALVATAALGAIAMLLPAVTLARPEWTVVMSGLDNPRGLTFEWLGNDDGRGDRHREDIDGWALFVAEAGTGGTSPCAMVRGALQCAGETGAVSRLYEGRQRRVVRGLPSYAAASGIGATGPHDVSYAWGSGYVSIGLGGPLSPIEMRSLFGEQFGWIVQFQDSGRWSFDTDVASYEQQSNPGGGPIDSNPYGLLKGAGRRILVDAGGNSLLHISPLREVSTIAVFPSRAQGRATDAVSNSVALGPDDAYYLGELTGVPFVPETSNVWRVVPGQEPQVYCTGFNFILDLDFDRLGNLYVLEHSSAPFPEGDGTLYRVSPDCSRRPVATGLTNPSSVTIGPDGNAYVSNFGTSPDVGEVIRVDLTRRDRERHARD